MQELPPLVHVVGPDPHFVPRGCGAAAEPDGHFLGIAIHAVVGTPVDEIDVVVGPFLRAARDLLRGLDDLHEASPSLGAVRTKTFPSVQLKEKLLTYPYLSYILNEGRLVIY